MRSREERSQFFDNIGPETGLLSEESDLFVNDTNYDKVISFEAYHLVF